MKTLVLLLVIWPFLGTVVTWICGKYGKSGKLRNAVACLTVSVSLALSIWLCLWSFLQGPASGKSILEGLQLTDGFIGIEGICGSGIHFAIDGFRVLYVTIASFMWFVCTLFSFEYMKHYENQNRYYFFLLLTLGATTGVFLASDFFTLFIFFEVMSFASYVWVAQDERKESLKAAETYLAIAVIGGLCVLMGLFLLENEEYRVAAGILMLIGFGAKAGVAPLHIWLPKAHPVAPAPASALLSGILTKTGVFGSLLLVFRIFWGNRNFGILLFILGILTMVIGAILALFSVDLKRTLACSSISQIGFVFTGLSLLTMLSVGEFVLPDGMVDEEITTAFWGTFLHMINHSLLKLLLFCVAGVVFMNLHKLNLNDIRGYGRKKPLLNILFLTGALGISGVPLFNGYVSKSLIHEGFLIMEELFIKYGSSSELVLMKIAEWIFIISGGLTLAYMSKIYIAVFWEKNEDSYIQATYDEKTTYMSMKSSILLILCAIILPVLGIGSGVYFHLFNIKTVLEASLSLLIGVLVYLFFVRKWMILKGQYVNRWNSFVDLEERVYRPVFNILALILSVICRFLDKLTDYCLLGLRKTVFKDSPIPHELEEGDVITHTVGSIIDDALHHNQSKTSIEHKLALWKLEMKENNTMIGRSLSFGLLLFCIGLLCTVIYMLLI